MSTMTSNDCGGVPSSMVVVKTLQTQSKRQRVLRTRGAHAARRARGRRLRRVPLTPLVGAQRQLRGFELAQRPARGQRVLLRGRRCPSPNWQRQRRRAARARGASKQR